MLSVMTHVLGFSRVFCLIVIILRTLHLHSDQLLYVMSRAHVIWFASGKQNPEH